jgi:hypothetical protein
MREGKGGVLAVVGKARGRAGKVKPTEVSVSSESKALLDCAARG